MLEQCKPKMAVEDKFGDLHVLNFKKKKTSKKQLFSRNKIFISTCRDKKQEEIMSH